MAIPSPQEITQLLVAWNNSDAAAREQLTPLVQSELHRLAKRYLAGERAGHLLQTTALVNEAFMRLIDWQNVEWRNRSFLRAGGADHAAHPRGFRPRPTA